LNDGQHVYNHDEDGGGMMTEGGCQAFFRNVDYPTYMRITYRRKYMTLLVETNVGGNGEWTDCFSQNDVWLPENAYFGATASTGDLADNHDIISISVEPPPVPTADFISAWKKHKATSPGGSLEMANKMKAAMKKKMQNPFDMKKMVSNHKKKKQEREEMEEASSGTGLLIGLFALLVVGGAVAYFVMKPKDEKKLRNYSSGGF
jgi:mannose-binding lectin 2